MNVPIVIGVVVFFAVVGSVVALWWWRIADRWAAEEEKRFKSRVRERPREVTIRKDGGRAEGG
jgi:hypothetical protein